MDTELVERRRREDAALEQWAALTVRRDEIDSARDEELGRLDTERDRVRQAAADETSSVKTEQAGVLLELNRDGRTVEQLATLFGVPLKQVRDLLRAAKSDTTTAPGAAVPTATGGAGERPQSPPARPHPAAGTDHPGATNDAEVSDGGPGDGDGGAGAAVPQPERRPAAADEPGKGAPGAQPGTSAAADDAAQRADPDTRAGPQQLATGLAARHG